MPAIYSNNVAGTLNASVLATDTLFLLGTGQGAKFPTPSGGNYFYATVVHSVSGLVEVVKVTARSADTLTVTRAQDSTTAIAFTSGSVIEMRLCAQMLRDMDYNAAKGVASGLASLGADGFVPDAQISTLVARTAAMAATYLPLSQRAAANGVATLDASSLIPVAQIPSTIARQTDIAASVANYVPLSQRGAASGVATLDGASKVPVAQIPALGYLPTTGGTLTSSLTVQGDITMYDLRSYRSGAAGQGIVWLGNSGARYLYYDGSTYTLPGANVYAPDFIATSDRRTKKDIVAVKADPMLADQIRLREWTRRDDGGHGFGVVAQDLQKYAPRHVRDEGKYLGVDKAGLALEAVVGLASRVRRLEKELARAEQNTSGKRADLSRPR